MQKESLEDFRESFQDDIDLGGPRLGTMLDVLDDIDREIGNQN